MIILKVEPAFNAIKEAILLIGSDALLFLIRTNAQSINRKNYQNRPR